MKFLLISLILMFMALPLYGQSKVSDVTIVLDTLREFEPAIIGVDDVRYVGIDMINKTDSIIYRNCGIILSKDLDFSPFFETIGIDPFFLKTMEIKEMTVPAWKWREAEYLVRLEVEFSGDKIKIKYRLYAVNSNREIRSEKFDGRKTSYRYVVHDVANDIYKFLTGDKGVYHSKIVYSKDIGDAKELFMADFDGRNERQLTNNGSINILPTATKDGEYIYFTSYLDGDPKIYLLTVKSGKVDLVSGQDGLNSSPAISPNGKNIACVLSKDGNSELYVLKRNGKIKKRLTRTWQIETSPSWSPDGRRIAFTSDRTGSPQIYIMDNEGLNIERLSYKGGYNASPSWSPKGDLIAFVSRGNGFDICSIDVTGKNFKTLAHYGNNESPCFSPDGNMIIFSSDRLGGQDLFIMDFFGGNIQRITKGGGYSNPIWIP